jgi:hypothetical protein
VVSITPLPLSTPGKDAVPVVQEARWVSGPIWTGAENLAPTGIRSPHRPARSLLLYRLSYPAHYVTISDLIQSRAMAAAVSCLETVCFIKPSLLVAVAVCNKISVRCYMFRAC